jgi:hypothetical protein
MNRKELYQWLSKTSKEWQGVTRHFQENVRHFSEGVARAKHSQVRKIAGCVKGEVESQRRRLQRFVAREVEISHWFGEWTQSVVKTLAPREIVLVVDETKLEDRFGVMVVGLVHGRRCIPLAWRVYLANHAAAYPPQGQVQMILSLLQAVQAGLPSHLAVRVLADRGIGTSPDLMLAIMQLGWHFLFRVTKQSKIILPDGESVTFYEQVTTPGQHYQASGKVFKNRGRIPAHVRVLWGQGAREPWALVTNDPQLTGWEYAKRFWIEESFRDLKSHGWQVEQALLTCPQRMARLWILLVVAYTWLLLWGCALIDARRRSLKRHKDGAQVARCSFFRLGWQDFIKYSCHPT